MCVRGTSESGRGLLQTSRGLKCRLHTTASGPRSKNSGLLDQTFGNEREIGREPGVDPAFERANPGDSLGSQQQRHTGAGRFVGSRTVENDVAIAGNLNVALFDLFHGDTKRARDHLRKRLDIHGLAQVHD